MATKKKTQSRKSVAKNKSANRQMILYFVSLILIFFAATQLGIFGVTLYNLVRLFVGATAYLGILLYLAYLIVRLIKKYIFKDYKRLIPGTLLIYLGIILLVQAIFAWKLDSDVAFWNILSDLSHFRVSHSAGGGFIGWILYFPIKALFSKIGAFIVSALLIIVGIFLAVPNSLGFLRLHLTNAINSMIGSRQERKEAKKNKEAEAIEPEKLEKADADSGNRMDAPRLMDSEKEETEALNFDNYYYQETENNPMGMITDLGADWHDVYEPEKERSFNQEMNFVAEADEMPDFSYGSDGKMLTYQLPTSQLLTKIPPKNQSKEQAQVKKNIEILENTFQSFGISASVDSAVVGPSVTKYEVKLAQGVRVNRVANLADDLALALAAKDVRIEAPIPGKSLVGIEIPNLEIATVGFRDMLESAKTDPNKLLEIPLGKALDGSIRTFDLAKMPHLLIAGSTGSGKSVAVNGMIASILMKTLPSEVKFLMVDPKMVELSVYNDIPQLLIPVVTNPRKAARALQKVVDEMENRYELFSHLGVRNIAGYNEKIERQNQQSEVKTPLLPLIVVIVDELADLMMVASKEVEDAIIRLGQKARAAGIHMILATQRPSVDVISGLIKANVPSRVAFAVSSGTDSRTILDTNGAEKLLGRGDMLFKPIDENHPIRLQGAFLSDTDVEKIVNFIKSQTEPDYDDTFDPGEAEDDNNRTGYAGSSESSDPLFEEAKAMVVNSQKASVAQLQRILKVGFNRATDLMNELEAAGVVGPAKGTTPRKVLMNASGDFSGDDE